MALFHVCFVKEVEYTIEASDIDAARKASKNECTDRDRCLDDDSVWEVASLEETALGSGEMGAMNGKFMHITDYHNALDDGEKESK